MKTDVPAFNQLVKDQNIPAIVVKPPHQPVNGGLFASLSVGRGSGEEFSAAHDSGIIHRALAVFPYRDELSVNSSTPLMLRRLPERMAG